MAILIHHPEVSAQDVRVKLAYLNLNGMKSAASVGKIWPQVTISAHSKLCLVRFQVMIFDLAIWVKIYVKILDQLILQQP